MRVKFYIDGIWYKPEGWFGCQLVSYEFFRPKSHNRTILGYEFEVFQITRDYWYQLAIPKPWYEISWTLKDLRCASTIDQKNILINKFYSELKKEILPSS